MTARPRATTKVVSASVGAALSEEDILRAALLMIARHGRQARSRAEFRAAALHQAGELRAALTWRMVMRRIDELATGRDGGSASGASGTA